jgi:hypothetical protein
MSSVLKVDWWCPKCRKVFTSTKIVERVGRDETSTTTPSPECESPGELLLSR